MDTLRTIQIESSTACNGRCTFCPRFDMKRKSGSMTDELFYKIVDEATEMGVTKITPFLNGEPFLFPRLFSWLDYLRDRHITFDLYTNASMMNKEKADKINTYENIEHLCFSMHGWNKETYEKQMGINYEVSKRNVDYFISIAKIPYRVHMIASEDNIPGAEEFRKTWGENAAMFKYANWAGARPADMSGEQHPCQRILEEMTVYWDGRVNLCCMDSDGGVILGDLNTQTVKEVWESNQWMRDRHKNLDFDLTLCRDCNFNRY